MAIAEAIANDDYTDQLAQFAKTLLEDPGDPYQLANLAFLMANKEGVFALVGQPSSSEWCTLETQVVTFEDDDDDDDDLDFEMF